MSSPPEYKGIKAEGDELARKIQPTRDMVFCRLLNEDKKIGSIFIPDTFVKGLDLVVSQVMARGPEVKAKKWELGVGDYVLHVRVVGIEYDGILGSLGKDSQQKGASYRFLHEKDILAVVDPGAVVSGYANASQGSFGEWNQDKA